MPEQMDRMRDWVVEATDRERVAAGRRVYHYLPLYKVDHAVRCRVRTAVSAVSVLALMVCRHTWSW